MQTISGRAWDLLDPDPANIDFGDIAGHLARLSRFTGAVPGGVYSVAQHCVAGCDAILAETGDTVLAAAFLLHDAHEAYLGDIGTPQQKAVDRLLHETIFGCPPPKGGGAFVEVLGTLKRRHDWAILAAAGLPWPDKDVWLGVHEWDVRMLATEKRQLLAACRRRWDRATERAEPVRMKGALRIWPPARAAEEWMSRLSMLCPNAGHMMEAA